MNSPPLEPLRYVRLVHETTVQTTLCIYEEILPDFEVRQTVNRLTHLTRHAPRKGDSPTALEEYTFCSVNDNGDNLEVFAKFSKWAEFKDTLSFHDGTSEINYQQAPGDFLVTEWEGGERIGYTFVHDSGWSWIPNDKGYKLLDQNSDVKHDKYVAILNNEKGEFGLSITKIDDRFTELFRRKVLVSAWLLWKGLVQ
ncbi:hypothetical protein M413DRAFT_31687 [Hebeloma cylindrosporum]|uniref:Uncharacterized protein n=1 Tax=Hebeloma cylindrosporum TaxID=76867 RepID=A0A0C3BWJ9_HEBCY|nr:hypothetical protein M413DRAFT_31687 [Hebeloma cylindrosporum h7]